MNMMKIILKLLKMKIIKWKIIILINSQIQKITSKKKINSKKIKNNVNNNNNNKYYYYNSKN